MATLSEHSGLSKLVERQMRNWELSCAQRIENERSEKQEVHEFIAISRMVGTSGSEVARLLSEKLGWPVFDKELLQYMAGTDGVRKKLYEMMDERDLGWLEKTLRGLTEGRYGRDDYFHRLSETVLTIARHGPAIFLGRAADLILPEHKGLRVRLAAPREQRMRNYAQETAQPENDQLRSKMEAVERERDEFIQHHFSRKTLDVSRYDLVINLQRFSAMDAAELILNVMRLRRILG